MEVNNMLIANNIKKFMNKQGLTQSQLADELGVNKSSVHLWVNGKGLPRMDKFDQMTKIFNCNLTDLIESEETLTRNYDLSVDEYKILLEYRGLKSDQKKEFIRLMRYVRGLNDET